MVADNLACALYKLAVSQPDQMVLAIPAKAGKRLPRTAPIPYRTITFKSLADQTNCLSRGLLELGLKRGDRVVLMVPPGLDFFALCFALLQSGIIPVLIDPQIGMRYLKKCIAESKPSGFIGTAKAHAARMVFGWGRNCITMKITVGRTLFRSGTALKRVRDAGRSNGPIVCCDVKGDDLAAILFTTGATGVPKGVMYTHDNFCHQVEIIRRTFNVQREDIDLPTFPPFALFNVAAGLTTVIADIDVTRPARINPEMIIRVIQQFNVTSLFGSPVLIDRVGQYGEANKISLPSLKRVFSAGAPVPAKALKRFSTMLNPAAQIFTPYGATEAMPVTSIGSHEILAHDIQQRVANGAGICIGKPVETINVKVIRITDEPIPVWCDDLEVPTGTVGEIAVQGKNITCSYFNRDAATRLAKISDGDTFWHRMGDLGYKDVDGNLWFCGRKSHRVKIAGKELYSVQCESIFNKHANVYRTALVEVNNRAILCVEVDKRFARSKKKQIRQELIDWAQQNELTRDIQTVLFHPSFPVDARHNAKIFREKLSLWAAQRLSKIDSRKVFSILFIF